MHNLDLFVFICVHFVFLFFILHIYTQSMQYVFVTRTTKTTPRVLNALLCISFDENKMQRYKKDSGYVQCSRILHPQRTIYATDETKYSTLKIKKQMKSEAVLRWGQGGHALPPVRGLAPTDSPSEIFGKCFWTNGTKN